VIEENIHGRETIIWDNNNKTKTNYDMRWLDEKKENVVEKKNKKKTKQYFNGNYFF